MPKPPDLVGAAEASKLLGVSRQRFYQLQEVYPDFPAPAAQLARGALWARDALVAWEKQWSRQPGRPRRDHNVK